MKSQITNYVFSASAKTITFTDYSTIRLDSVLLITNVTDNIIIYNFADATKGGTVATNVLTLTYSTVAMDDTDKLMIYYDDSDVAPATSDLQETLYSLTETLQTLSQRLEVLASMANAGAPALRTIPIASVSTAVSGSLTTAGTVSTVGSITNFGTSIPASEMAHDINNYTAIIANINNAVAA